MTTGTDPTSMLMNQQAKQQAGADEQGIADAFEVIFKIIFWVIDHIPYINTWFLNHYNSTIPDTAAKTFKERELIQLSAFPCPSFFTARQIDHFRPRIAQDYCQLIARTNQAPLYSICYSMLGAVATNRTCTAALDERVTEFYQRQTTVHLGVPDQAKHPTLSSDFISSCVRVLPPIPLTELFIHGPIATDEDRKKLTDIIINTKSLATLHCEVEKTSAIYFTQIAHFISVFNGSTFEFNHTITVFNLTLMGPKSALTFDRDPWEVFYGTRNPAPLDTNPWEALNTQTQCTLTYTNVAPPEGFASNKLTFH